ncbi:MAG: hypothetical protein ACRD1T_14695 [Acidimicrobiia bacterium]
MECFSRLGKNGTPMVVAGHQFPVLRAAQIRQAKPVIPNAIARDEDEQPRESGCRLV